MKKNLQYAIGTVVVLSLLLGLSLAQNQQLVQKVKRLEKQTNRYHTFTPRSSCDNQMRKKARLQEEIIELQHQLREVQHEIFTKQAENAHLNAQRFKAEELLRSSKPPVRNLHLE